MIAAKKTILVLCLLLIAGCGQLNVNIKSNLTTATNNYFTVVVSEGSSTRDRLGIKVKLEQRLMVNGLNVRGTSSKPQSENSGNYYLIQCNYMQEWKTFRGGRVFTNFSASVVNLKTDEVVAVADLTGDRRISGVLDDFVNQLAPMVKH